jgi:glucokinase
MECPMEYYIGVDVGGSKILAILASYNGEVAIIDRERKPTHGEEEGEAIIDRIASSIDALLSRNVLDRSSLSGIGLVVPGPVDPRKGIIIECPNIPELNGAKVRQIFEERYRIPVGLDNDAHAAALAEARVGAGRWLRHFIYICLGTGIGCGIIINGELYRGADGAAGELSHVIFPGLGSFHSIASGNALKKKFAIDAEELRRLCEEKDPNAIEAFQHLIHYLGIGIGNMVTLFNPEAVVIGGGLSSLGDFLLLPLEKEVRRSAFSISGRNFAFMRAANSIEAEAIGSIFVCRDELQRVFWGAANVGSAAKADVSRPV